MYPEPCSPYIREKEKLQESQTSLPVTRSRRAFTFLAIDESRSNLLCSRYFSLPSAKVDSSFSSVGSWRTVRPLLSTILNPLRIRKFFASTALNYFGASSSPVRCLYASEITYLGGYFASSKIKSYL